MELVSGFMTSLFAMIILADIRKNIDYSLIQNLDVSLNEIHKYKFNWSCIVFMVGILSNKWVSNYEYGSYMKLPKILIDMLFFGLVFDVLLNKKRGFRASYLGDNTIDRFWSKIPYHLWVRLILILTLYIVWYILWLRL